MSVAPARLECITPDDVESRQFKAVFRVAYVRPDNSTEHIRLAAASRAWAGAAQKLKIEIRFAAVTPMNCQLVSDLLNVGRLQTHEWFATGRISPSADRP